MDRLYSLFSRQSARVANTLFEKRLLKLPDAKFDSMHCGSNSRLFAASWLTWATSKPLWFASHFCIASFRLNEPRCLCFRGFSCSWVSQVNPSFDPSPVPPVPMGGVVNRFSMTSRQLLIAETCADLLHSQLQYLSTFALQHQSIAFWNVSRLVWFLFVCPKHQSLWPSAEANTASIFLPIREWNWWWGGLPHINLKYTLKIGGQHALAGSISCNILQSCRMTWNRQGSTCVLFNKRFQPESHGVCTKADGS